MIFFDIDGTLIDHDSAYAVAALELSRELGVEEANAVSATQLLEKAMLLALGNRQCYEFVAQGASIVKSFCDLTGTGKGADCEKLFAGYISTYVQHCRLYEDAMPVLKEISAVHKLGIITNGDRATQLQKLSNCGIANFFASDLILCADEIEVSKPDRRIFDHACRQADRQASTCVYIGDNVHHDARGAQDAGIMPILIQRVGQPEHAFLTVNSLHKLPALLQNLSPILSQNQFNPTISTAQLAATGSVPNLC